MENQRKKEHLTFNETNSYTHKSVHHSFFPQVSKSLSFLYFFLTFISSIFFLFIIHLVYAWQYVIFTEELTLEKNVGT